MHIEIDVRFSVGGKKMKLMLSRCLDEIKVTFGHLQDHI
jgi:hypothetical protein